MRGYKRFAVVTVLSALMVLTAKFEPAQAQTKVGSSVSNLGNFSDPKSFGMGGCLVTNVNARSAYQSPGTLGLFHLDKVLSVAIPIKLSNWPGTRYDSYTKVYGGSLGASTSTFGLLKSSRLRLAFGVSYFYRKFDSGSYWGTTYENSGLGQSYGYTLTNETYTISAAIEYYVRFSAGYSYHDVMYSWRGTESSGSDLQLYDNHDLSLVLEVPVASLLNREIQSEDGFNRTGNWEVTPATAYYYNHEAETGAFGFSLFVAQNRALARLGSVRLAFEKHYPSGFDSRGQDKAGGELGLLDIVFVRIGTYNSSVFTYGFGFSLHGVIMWLMETGRLNDRMLSKYPLLGRFDISFDYATHDAAVVSDDRPALLGIDISF